jgi:cytochrome d ubiquinol oxidase subunit I
VQEEPVNPIILSRWQFAITTVYHFFFVPLTLGLVWFVAILETIYVRTGHESYKQMARFWGKLLLINFAMGVVTGIVQEFQFGMNWSEYSRYVGDIFGAPLAIEALLAFFLESTFLGIWIFGWDRLSKGMHAATIWLVAIGSNLSALWILLANGWMQHPVGYVFNEAAGRAELVDFIALMTNPRGWLFFWHTISSGLATAGFFVLGISAYHLARKQNLEVFRRAFRLAAIIGISGAVMVIVSGDVQGRYLREVQPMAAAASEALWDTANPAPFSVVALFGSSGRDETWSWRIPSALSLLYYLKPEGEVQGIHDIQAEYEATYGPGNYVPAVALDFWMFRLMVGVGFLMVALTAVALYLPLRKWPEKWTRRLKWMVWAIPLPYIANTSGWILTETARQPWIVTGLLRTENGVSPNLTAGLVLFSLVGFALLYAALMVADVYLLFKFAKAGPEADKRDTVDVDPAAVRARDE